MKIQKNQDKTVNVTKILVIILAVYIVIVLLLFWLMGEQLHLRKSRGNFDMPTAEAGTVELSQGAVVEQRFSVTIQRLQSVSVQWGTYYRPNAGTVTMELFNTANNSLVASEKFEVSQITEGGLTTISLETPDETICDKPLLLRITADSLPGSAVSPLMSVSAKEDKFSLFVNGAPVDGVLCVSVTGEDYIWTGLHYWEFAAGFGGLLVIIEFIVWFRWKKGKRSFVVNAFTAVKKYKFLIRQLVSRDFKTKYKRSLLGVFWSFLNPLLTMAVQYVVFSNLFRFDVPNYPVYLITGIVIFNFFSEATNMALGSVIGNAGLITKVYMPKYIYPLTRVISSLVNLVISLIPLLMVALFSGIVPTKAYFLVFFVLICTTFFSLGIGMLLAAAMVFFRDIQFLWSVFTMIWMYLTPIFYPASILPENLSWVLDVNPLNYFIKFARTCIIDGISPEPIVYFQCGLMALCSMIVGAFVFHKSQDKFVLYL